METQRATYERPVVPALAKSGRVVTGSGLRASSADGDAGVAGGAYGERMGAYLGLDGRQTIAVRTKGKAVLAFTRLRSESAFHETSTAIPAEPAFLVNVFLRDVAMFQWQEKDGPGPERVLSTDRGGVSIVSLEGGAAGLQTSAFDCVQFYIPRAALDEIADEHGARRVRTLVCPAGRVDAVMKQLCATILEAMKGPGASHRPFVDHALLALLAHVARVYGEMRVDALPARGGLAPWQTRRAVELLTSNIEGELCMSHVARECELSVSYFVRAFKQTMGVPPYRWLTEQRIKRAKELLLHPGLPMADIAVKCGFADLACFIRAFKRTADGTPGEWRRTHRAH